MVPDPTAVLRALGPDFARGEGATVLRNITATLDCSPADIRDVVPIDEGLTNMSFVFSVEGRTYVYRHPGPGTDRIISRESETFSQSVARELGLDSTFIHEDPMSGWKLSRFIRGCVPFDYHDPRHVREAMRIARTLHHSPYTSQWSADLWEKTETVLDLLDPSARAAYPDFETLLAQMRAVHARTAADRISPCLCHVDLYAPNLLVHDDRVDLIDWEYSGMGDYATDLGTFITASDYTPGQVLAVLAIYFQREPTPSEIAHCLGGVALAGYYWFVWAIYQAQCENPVGAYLEMWHRYAVAYGDRALTLYGR